MRGAACLSPVTFEAFSWQGLADFIDLYATSLAFWL